jgi:hypothetical protein
MACLSNIPASYIDDFKAYFNATFKIMLPNI